ncbi:unnamed protein product [Brassicogethes aeneus]|uniref:protein xylosyltransferase n=1 Tax=Brassicogethes aeneus TaxID=1431903 RepID=A0A9P0AR03_BRAAE|nr:unnamed protein product [Brassicogethes aeneus]
MVNVKSAKNNNIKWIRRYRTYFICGFVILSIQIFISFQFVSTNKESNENKWEPQNIDLPSNLPDVDFEINSARKNKNDRIDDEDSKIIKVKETVKNSTIVTKNILRLEELDFVPACHINNKEAISAIHRAKSQKCKQILANITCLSNAGKMYPKELSSSCPTGNFSLGRQLGCYKDEKNFRLLNGYYGAYKKDNSPEYCINLCLQSGFQYAGVQYGYECFCGHNEPPSTSKLPDSSCNMKCPVENTPDTCGGYYTINVYETGIKKFISQVAKTELAYEESQKRPARIVFLLTLNGRALRQVKRLIRILYNANHYYYIHVDVRQDYLFRELLALERNFPNIRLTRKRFATIWGGASLLEMLLSCMRELLELTQWKWDFVLNLSESDFPVKSVQQLTDFLTANKGKNFVKSHGREVQRFIQKQGLDKTFVECETRMWRVGDRVLPVGVQVDGGSDWIALSHKFVRYVAVNRDDLVAGLLRIFKYTLLPAESFFHTALRNSKFCDTYVDNNLHVTNWKRKLGCKCQYKHVVDWCGCSPNDFRPEDWQRIQNTFTRQLYFARKFEPIINQAVILQLELWIHGLDAPSKMVPNLHSYWQCIYHHYDMGVAKDDGLLTFANSISRRLHGFLQNGTCSVNMEKFTEATSYHHKDSYKYTLLKFQTSEGFLEVAVKPNSKVTVLKPSPLMEHLNYLAVSSDYDQKEQTSRNFIRILSPYSDPNFIYHFNAHKFAKTYNMSCLWINPAGFLEEVTEVSIDENSLIASAKSNLKQPILPGVWTLKLIYKTAEMASVKFLVLPLQFFSGNAVTASQVEFLHGNFAGKKFAGNFDDFLPKVEEREVLKNAATANSKRFDKNLTEWIDRLTSTFYAVEKLCVSTKSKSIEICGRTVNACRDTYWSSEAPDPKSAIFKDDLRTNGTFSVW